MIEMGTIIISLFGSIVVAIITSLIIFNYRQGKLTAQIEDVKKRIERLENKIFDKFFENLILGIKAREDSIPQSVDRLLKNLMFLFPKWWKLQKEIQFHYQR